MSPRDLINILCVEDNEDDVILIERALRANGVTAALQRVDNLAATSNALFRQPWDIVLCDYAMPRMRVEDVLAITAERTPDLPVVLLTGMVGDEAVADLMRLGIVDVVLKQRLTTRLAAIVTREVKRYRDHNAHIRLLNGVNALLAGFDAASDWRDALLMSLDHMVKSFEASAAVMWETLGKSSAIHAIAYSRRDGRSALDQVSQDLHVGATLISKAIGSGTIMMAQRGTAGSVDAETESLINDLSLRGFTDIICQPFILDDAAFGLTLLFDHSLTEPDTVMSDIRLTAQLLRPALVSKWSQYERNVLREALDAVRTGVMITDAMLDPPGPKIIYANQALARMSGFSVAEMLDNSPRIFHGPNTSRAALNRLRAALEVSTPAHVELVNYRKDGTPFQIELDITPVFDQGRLTHFMSIQRDVTRTRQYERERDAREAAYREERLQAETNLRLAKERAEAAEAFLRDAVESMSEGVVIFGPDDRILVQNTIHQDLSHGVQSGAPRDSTFYELLDKFCDAGGGFRDDSRTVEDFRRERIRAYREATGSLEFQINDRVWVRATDRRMKDGSTVGLRVDITELKRTQHNLLEMQRNFRSVAESISEIFWIADMKKNALIFVNGAYERIYGRDRNELYSASYSRFDAVHPDDRSRVRQAFRTLMKSDSCVVEYRIVRPDGAVRWLHEAAYTSRIDSECVTHCAGVAEDITLRRQYEMQLRQGQKMEALGGLVGGMAHDFNNILGVIMASLDLIKRHINQDKFGIELCDEALFSAERGTELIKNLLAFARRQSLQPKAIDANSLITIMQDMLQRALGESVTLRISLAADLWLVSVDPIQLETALLNFVTNARDAMPDGGTFDIVTRNRSLAAEDSHLHAELPPGDYVQIELRDTGVGIPSDSIAHIFEPFFTTKAPGVGTGLGLAMVYGFVRQSGGQLTVYSEPGRGTVFHMYLPRVADCQAHVLTQTIDEPVTGGVDIVLLVEDNVQLRRAVAAQLADLGYQVRQAEDARAALMILETDEPFDLLFTDIVMPGRMDGIALAERAIALRPGLKILLTSGFPDVPNAKSRIETAAFGVLSKPYSRGDLARAVRRTLDQPATTEG